jgi:hypothetical protein
MQGPVDWDRWMKIGWLVYYIPTSLWVFGAALWSALTVLTPDADDERPVRKLVGAVLFATVAGLVAPVAFIFNGFERLFGLGVSGLRALTGWPPAEPPVVYDLEYWKAKRDAEGDDRDG